MGAAGESSQGLINSTQVAVLSDRHHFGFNTGSRGDGIGGYMPDNAVWPPKRGMIAYPDCIAIESPLSDQKAIVVIEEWSVTPPPMPPQQTEWRLVGEVRVSFSESSIRGDCIVMGASEPAIELHQGAGSYIARAWVKGSEDALSQERAHAALYTYNEGYLLQLWPVEDDDSSFDSLL
ncbi:hypothetical protein ACWGJ0_30070 [Streptomyces massasporeus]